MQCLHCTGMTSWRIYHEELHHMWICHEEEDQFCAGCGAPVTGAPVCSRHSLRPGGTAQPYARRPHPAGRDSNRRKPGCSCRPARARLAGTATGANRGAGVCSRHSLRRRGRSPAIRPPPHPAGRDSHRRKPGRRCGSRASLRRRERRAVTRRGPKSGGGFGLPQLRWCWCLRWAQQGTAVPPPGHHRLQRRDRTAAYRRRWHFTRKMIRVLPCLQTGGQVVHSTGAFSLKRTSSRTENSYTILRYLGIWMTL